MTATETPSAPRRRLKWTGDGKLAEKAVKTSVILRPQMHTKAKKRAREAGMSLSEYMASLLIANLNARPGA